MEKESYAQRKSLRRAIITEDEREEERRNAGQRVPNRRAARSEEEAPEEINMNAMKQQHQTVHSIEEKEL